MSNALTSPAADPSDAIFRQCVEFGPDTMVVLTADGQCRHVSPASGLLLGRSPGELVGTRLHDMALDPDRPVVAKLLAELGAGRPLAMAVFRARCAFGTWVWVEASAQRLPGQEGAVLSLRDISARKEEEALLIEANDLLRRRATLDPVTCLANRGHFTAALQRELRRAHRESQPLALLAIGVDDMRLFNDLYGRDAGDVALREVATAVEIALARPGDLAGRMRGPAFGAVLPSTDLSGAAPVAERLRQAVGDLALEHAGAPSGRVTVTIGLACSGVRAKAEALMQEACCEMEVARAAMEACNAAE